MNKLFISNVRLVNEGEIRDADVLVEGDRIERVERTAEGKSRVVLRDGSHVDAKELIISRRHVAEVKRRLKES